MLNHELNIEPEKFGVQKAKLIANALMKEHQNLKYWRPRINKETNKKAAEEAYRIIYDKYISKYKTIGNSSVGQILGD
jgi:hypothetical protein